MPVETKLEDLAVGQLFGSATRTVTADEIKRFAAEYDPQPFHLDEAAGAASMFRGLAASGWHTAAMSMRLFVDSFALEGGLIGAGGELRWPRPVRPGDTIRVETEVTAITPSRTRPGQTAVHVAITTFNQHDQPVQVFSPRLVVIRPAPEAAPAVDDSGSAPV